MDLTLHIIGDRIMTALDLAGNEPSLAKILQIESLPIKLSDYISRSDRNDFYQINFEGSDNRLNLMLSDLGSDADVKVIHDRNQNNIVESDEIVAFSRLGGTQSESINLSNLDAGRYFINVYQYEGDTSYNLTLSNNPVSDLLVAEQDLGTLRLTPRVLNNRIDKTNTSDIYKFSFDRASGFTLSLKGLNSDADVRLIQDLNNNSLVDDGEVVALSTLSGNSNESINLSRLEAGNYFVQVYQYTGDSDYELSLNRTSLEPNKRLNLSLDFATQGQNIWGNSPQRELYDSRFLGTSWDKSFSRTVIENRFLPNIGVYGSSSGRIGLQSDFRLNGGNLNASLPISLWLELPGEVTPGQTITVKSGFSIASGANFSSSGMTGNYDLDLIYGINAKAGVKVRNSQYDVINKSVQEKRLDLLNINSEGHSEGFSLGDYGNVNLTFPSLRTQGTLINPRTLTALNSSDFLRGTLDLDRLATTTLRAVGVPVPDLSSRKSVGFSKFGAEVKASAGYELLDAKLIPKVNLSQALNLTVDQLTGILTLENGDRIGFAVGQDIIFRVPEGIGSSLEASAVLDIGTTLKNKTSLGYDVDLDLQALSMNGEVRAKMPMPWPIPDIDVSRGFRVGPMFEKHFDLFEGSIANLYDRTFNLSGFNTQSFDLSVAAA